MIEFNSDGSIKLLGAAEKKKTEETNRFNTQKCIKLRREIVSEYAPKKCVLKIELSRLFDNTKFIANSFNYAKQNSQTPMKFIKINSKEFHVEIGTDFKRCSDCNRYVNNFREFFERNFIEDKGTCTFKGRDFNFEDYFE